jgi:transketolase
MATAGHPTHSRETIDGLSRKSIQYRKTILGLIHTARAGHTGGSLSCVDLLNVLYNHVMHITPQNFTQIDRDHYVHSKGHAVEALYAVLLDLGFYAPADLYTLEKHASPFIGHPTRSVPGIEQNTGALGHGLSLAVGMALAARLDARDNRIFTIMGDGEMAEGSIWEASACAAQYQLDNLVAIVDRNGLQISGKTEDVMRLEPLEAKLSAFGYAVRHVDGHDLGQLVTLFDSLPFVPGKPNFVIAHTRKGKGVSFIEDRAGWHHRVATDAEYEAAIQELDAALESTNGND